MEPALPFGCFDRLVDSRNYSVHPLGQDIQGRVDGGLEERQLLPEVWRRSTGSSNVNVQNLRDRLVLEAGDRDCEYLKELPSHFGKYLVGFLRRCRVREHGVSCDGAVVDVREAPEEIRVGSPFHNDGVCRKSVRLAFCQSTCRLQEDTARSIIIGGCFNTFSSGL